MKRMLHIPLGFIAEFGDDILGGASKFFQMNFFLTDLLVFLRADALVWYECTAGSKPSARGYYSSLILIWMKRK